ncbi:putative sterigmatocystin biosynthesis P450 monooxygenase [Lachnellula suecica]|uniref:Putative sterigmatocystin biosynthesis P450 monooxygenase n=1 Tax=Lachnellula suecica TaxID=602035 RepID=A0A8T9BXM6_9HELO|nr:putative sterigmatocystin biosynthesis P450 monooxygenase [Lachnellula suecica]
MVSLKTVHQSNAQIATLPQGLVASFIGATSGIGQSALQHFAQHASSPRIYTIARPSAVVSHENLLASIRESNPSGTYSLITADTSLVSEVDRVVNAITQKESKLDILFMSAGFTIQILSIIATIILQFEIVPHSTRWSFPRKIESGLTRTVLHPKTDIRVKFTERQTSPPHKVSFTFGVSHRFSAGNILKLVPNIIEEVLVFRDNLIRHAKRRDVFSLEKYALKVTLNVIGNVALDTELKTQGGQREYNEMTSAPLEQRKWAAFGLETDSFTIINPMRYFHMWRNTKKMDHYINSKLDHRYNTIEGHSNSKTIIDLALNGFVAKSELAPGHLDATFRKYALSQMKVFIFSGHDTTASTICYSWLLLSRNPEAMAKLRAEHDEVLGLDKTKAAAVLIDNPALLNSLPYTLAVIKETLRLFPVVSSPRMGQPGFLLVDSKSRHFPTDGCLVWANHHGLHNNPLWWPHVTEFLPERFLVSDEDELDVDLRPLKNAWRPFEFGPRACIGVELALTEIKIVLALTVREFDVKEAYTEWDRANGTKGIKKVDGERVYQIQLGSAHPSDGFPARVKLQ